MENISLRKSNLVDAVGYSVRRLHTGLLYYFLCGGEEGNADISWTTLRSLLSLKNIDVSSRSGIETKMGEAAIDLVVRTQDKQILLGVEMKVDSMEWGKRQLERVKRKLDKIRGKEKFEKYCFICVTVGNANNFDFSLQESVVRLPRFIGAVEETRKSSGLTMVDERLLDDWLCALKLEEERQRDAYANLKSKLQRENYVSMARLRKEILAEGYRNNGFWLCIHRQLKPHLKDEWEWRPDANYAMLDKKGSEKIWGQYKCRTWVQFRDSSLHLVIYSDEKQTLRYVIELKKHLKTVVEGRSVRLRKRKARGYITAFRWDDLPWAESLQSVGERIAEITGGLAAKGVIPV